MACGGHGLLLLAAVFVAAFRPAFMQRFGDLRLTGYGASRLAGRLELFDGSKWWSICNDRFEGHDANVVCAQLGLGYAVHVVNIDSDASTKYVDASNFVQGTKDVLVGRYGIGPPIGVDNLQCVGSESHLLQCPFTSASDCYPWEAVGVQCSDYRPQPYSGEVRLVGGEFPSEGRLEVYFNGQWGGVCREGVGQEAADTACRQLGYTHAASVTSSQDDINELVWLSSLSCQEGASCLTACLKGIVPTSTTTCNGSAAALVCGYSTALSQSTKFGSKDLCTLESLPGNGTLRLVDGLMENEGRVEVFLNGEWGTVCGLETQFSWGAADVLCRRLGYHTWSRRVFRSQFEGYGSSAGPMHLTSLNCSGGEGGWEQCHWENATFSPCTSGDAAGLACSTFTDRIPHGGVALRLGSGGHGLLLVANASTGLHPVCDATFGITEGHVACRQMGYSGAIAIRHNSYYGQISIPVSISHIHCNGNESHLLECQFRKDSESESVCSDKDLVGLQCSTGGAGLYGELRLTGNDANSSAGRLQVWVDGEWHPICSLQFTLTAGNVACRQLGYSGALHVYGDGRFGGSDGDGIFYVTTCHGWENRLVDCYHVPVAREYCGRDVAVECSLAPLMAEGMLRLAGGASISDGRLEVYRFAQWGTVCSHQFDTKDGDVACRELGYYGVDNILVENVSVTTAPLPINIHLTFCHGNESRLIDCAHEMSPWRCNHSMDVGLVCQVEEPTTSSPDTPSPPSSTVEATVPSNPSAVLSEGGVAALSTSLVVLLLLALTFTACTVLAVVYTQRRRRKRRRDREETDWMPGVTNDINFVNPKYDENAAAAYPI